MAIQMGIGTVNAVSHNVLITDADYTDCNLEFHLNDRLYKWEKLILLWAVCNVVRGAMGNGFIHMNEWLQQLMRNYVIPASVLCVYVWMDGWIDRECLQRQGILGNLG